MKDDVLKELEMRGTAVIRGIFSRYTGGYGAYSRQELIRLGDVSVQLGDVEDWLKFKDAQRAWFIKAGMVLGIISALLILITLRRSAS